MQRSRFLNGLLRSAFVALTATWATIAHAADPSITKTITSASTGLEAGATVTFDIVVTNNGVSGAFDVVVTDTPDGHFTSCSLDNVIGGTGGGDLFAAGFTFATFTGATANALDPGDSVTLQGSCDLDGTVRDNTSYANQAGVVWANSLGGGTQPQRTDSTSVSTASPQAFSAIIATSEAHTPDGTADTVGDPRTLVIGENVRFRTWFFVPSGQMVSTDLSNLLPTGLEYIAGSDVLVGLVSSSATNLTATGLTCSSGTAPRAGNDATDLSTLGLDCVVTPDSGGVGSGSDTVFNFGTVTNAEQDPGDAELIVIELNATIVGDTVPPASLQHQGRIQTGNSDVSSTADFALHVHPIVDISATVTPTTTGPNQTVEYVITLDHNGASGADALDVTLTDVLPAGMTYDGVSGITGPQIPASPGTDTCSISGLSINDADPNGAGLTISFDSLDLGDVCEVRYFATTDAGATDGQTYVTNRTSRTPHCRARAPTPTRLVRSQAPTRARCAPTRPPSPSTLRRC